MRCTIKDVADALGMSRNTVSKVLNGKSGVSPKTEKLVLDKARELHYYPSDTPSTTEQFKAPASQKEKGFILFLTRTSVNYSDFWINVMKGIESVIKKYNYELVLGIMDNQDIEALHFPSIIESRDIRGIILVELCDIKICDAVLAYHLPTVTLDMPREYEHLLGKMDIITMENKINIKQIVNLLIQKGCSKFAFAGDLTSNNVGHGFQERYEALCETLAENNLSLLQESCFLCETDQLFLNSNYMINKIRNLSVIPEVYICGNDWTAIQLSNSLQFLGYKIPDDISIVGFDNIHASKIMVPSLTTINTHKEYLGIASALCILNRIQNPDIPYTYSQYMTELIIRESTI